ncbi:single-strand DNA-binding protein [Arthrobacter alpinus]|uniref:Single-strand DNA-binding protein n=1 Tax=Arthrobacter alpinus TaxID=656366 RepID=A0A1H5PD32_9MICC|nr:hypothetical protein [Arthrobacter alpinus]SEF11620.1 single-strand DNA-binding protein [Arthrobacter alpinus]
MAGETTITVIGNLTSDPELRFTPVSREFVKTEGALAGNFTIDSTLRDFVLASNARKGSEAILFLTTAWREMAERVDEPSCKRFCSIVLGWLKPGPDERGKAGVGWPSTWMSMKFVPAFSMTS